MEMVELEKKDKCAETASSNVVSDDLSDSLIVESEQNSTHTMNNARGFVDKVIIAEFQVDAVMMGRIVNRQTLMAMTSKQSQRIDQ